MKPVIVPRLIVGRRPDEGVGEWLAAMVRGLDALEFLERSRELAAETVVADSRPRLPLTRRDPKPHHSSGENTSDPGSRVALR
jgi:hypothetical protein